MMSRRTMTGRRAVVRGRLRTILTGVGVVVAGCAGPDADGLSDGDAPVENDLPAAQEFRIPLDSGIVLGGVQLGGEMRDGTPLVVLHGGPGMDHLYLRPGLDSLAKNRRIIYPDQRGTGMTEAPLTPEALTFDAFVEDVERVRAWTGAERVDLLGHSWGTALAYHYALRYPERIRRMVLVSPIEPGTRFQERAGERRNAATDSATAAELREVQGSEAFRTGDPETIRRFYRLVFRPLLHDPSTDIEVSLSDRSARDGFAVMQALQGSMPDPELWSRLPEIRTPTLIVHGAADAYPVAMARELADALGSARLEIIEEAGHFPYIEAPAEFLSEVRAFLDAPGGS